MAKQFRIFLHKLRAENNACQTSEHSFCIALMQVDVLTSLWDDLIKFKPNFHKKSIKKTLVI